MPSHQLLYIAPFCHIPPVHGASQRGINLLLQLARGHQVTLLTYRKHDAAALQEWAAEHGIALRWLPGPPAASASRLLGRAVARRPPGFASHSPRAIAAAIDQAWAEQGPFDTLYFATQVLGQAALLRSWPARIALDLYDVYAPIARTKAAAVPVSRPYHWLFRLEAARVRRYEARVLRRPDLLLVTSEPDAAEAARLAPAQPIAVVPNGVDLPADVARAGQPSILMVGSYTYGPNAEGLRWFYQHVWPQVRQGHPRATLVLVGEGAEQLRALTNGDPQVSWAGRVAELRDYYQAAACVIVPIRSGGGTRLKLIEAMAWGVPVVATALGAQGVDHAGSVAIADAPAQFAEAVLARLRRPGEFSQVAERARAIVARSYTWHGIGDTLLGTITRLHARDKHT